MQSDTIRLLATYGIAVLVLVGSFVLLMFPSQVSQDQLVPFLTGIIGVTLGWAFNKESTTASARATERAVTLGQDSKPYVTTGTK